MRLSIHCEEPDDPPDIRHWSAEISTAASAAHIVISNMARRENRKSLMRNLGEFFGHITKAVKHDPAQQQVIRKDVEEEKRGDITLRRTTIEEIEVHDQREQNNNRRT